MNLKQRLASEASPLGFCRTGQRGGGLLRMRSWGRGAGSVSLRWEGPLGKAEARGGVSGRTSEQWGGFVELEGLTGSAPPAPVTLVSESRLPYLEIETCFSR